MYQKQSPNSQADEGPPSHLRADWAETFSLGLSSRLSWSQAFTPGSQFRASVRHSENLERSSVAPWAVDSNTAEHANTQKDTDGLSSLGLCTPVSQFSASAPWALEGNNAEKPCTREATVGLSSQPTVSHTENLQSNCVAPWALDSNMAEKTDVQDSTVGLSSRLSLSEGFTPGSHFRPSRHSEQLQRNNETPGNEAAAPWVLDSTPEKPDMQNSRKRKQRPEALAEKFLKDAVGTISDVPFAVPEHMFVTPSRTVAAPVVPAGSEFRAKDTNQMRSDTRRCGELQLNKRTSIPASACSYSQSSSWLPGMQSSLIPSLTTSVSAKDLQENCEGAWESFLSYSLHSFPLLGQFARERNSAEAFLEGLLDCSGRSASLVSNEAKLLQRKIAQRFNDAKEETLDHWRRVQDSQGNSMHHSKLRGSCEMSSTQAIVAAYRLELEEIKQHTKSMRRYFDALLEKRSKLEQVGSNLCRIRGELEARRRALDFAKYRVAADNLEPMEATCKRLREILMKRKNITRGLSLRTCRIQGVDAGIRLIFRGSHQLRMGKVDSSEFICGRHEEPLIWLRFEPKLALPVAAGATGKSFAADDLTAVAAEQGTPTLLEQWEIHLARLWLRAIEARPGDPQRAMIVVPRSKVAGIVRRLNSYSLDAEGLIHDLVAAANI